MRINRIGLILTINTLTVPSWVITSSTSLSKTNTKKSSYTVSTFPPLLNEHNHTPRCSYEVSAAGFSNTLEFSR